MPNLIDELLSMGGSAGIEDSMNSTFLKSKTTWVKEASEGCTKYNISPNETISKIAEVNKLNGDQIQRLVEETNVEIYLNKYAATKGQKVRRVEFELADAQKIAPVVKTASTASTALTAPTGYAMSASAFDILEKVASYTGDDNSLFVGADKPAGLWANEAMTKTASVAIKHKLSEKIAAANREKSAQIGSILEKVANLANAIIYSERAEGGGQDLFNGLIAAVDGDVNVSTAVINKTAMMVEDMKHFGRVPSNFDVVLAAPVAKKAFTLGSHSLIKTAAEEYTVSTKSLPDRMSYEKLVVLARQLKQEIDENHNGGPVKVRVK